MSGGPGFQFMQSLAAEGGAGGEALMPDHTVLLTGTAPCSTSNEIVPFSKMTGEERRQMIPTTHTTERAAKLSAPHSVFYPALARLVLEIIQLTGGNAPTQALALLERMQR